MKLNNPKTTMAGYLMLAGAVLTLMAHVMSSGTISAADLTPVLGAIGGLGLIAAQDGGH